MIAKRRFFERLPFKRAVAYAFISLNTRYRQVVRKIEGDFKIALMKCPRFLVNLL